MKLEDTIQTGPTPLPVANPTNIIPRIPIKNLTPPGPGLGWRPATLSIQ